MATSHTIHRAARRRKQRLLKRDGPTCHWCSRVFDPAALTIDHIVNVSECRLLGTPANRIGNLVLSCLECNLRRNREKSRLDKKQECRKCGKKNDRSRGTTCRACHAAAQHDVHHVYQKAKLLGMIHADMDRWVVSGYAKIVLRDCERPRSE